jgi:N-acetylneuraminic acid mutarotase
VAGVVLAASALLSGTPAFGSQSQGSATTLGSAAAAPAALTAQAAAAKTPAAKSPAAKSPAAKSPAGKTPTGKAKTTAHKVPTQQACAPAKAKDHATCFAQRRTDAKAVKGLVRATAAGAAAAPNGYGPTDLLSAYSLPTDGGAGSTVAIIDAQDDPNAESDLALYRSQYGLSACTTANGCFKKIDQSGGTSYPAPDAGWSQEISLDLDMVSAIAPQAHILLVEANTAAITDLAASVDTAVAAGAKYVSNSYGSAYNSTPGSGEAPEETTAYDPFYNHPGVVITASSGDSAYGVAYPAASPYVTSVGGTSLAKDTSARGWSESVWDGAGSGCSAYEAKPSFQKDSACAMRSVADVSAVADPATGVAVYDSFQQGGWLEFGGTSVASPIIASVYADAGAPTANSYPNSYPYLNPDKLNDVTQGSNGTCSPASLCTGSPGYDGPTGLGTPHGVAAFTAGPSGTVSGTVTDGTSPLAGATVAVDNGTSFVTHADGAYTFALPVGAHTISVSAFGYTTRTVSVTIALGGTVTQNIALTAVPSVTVSGKVTDASGHGWPLYATITVQGNPAAPVSTDPKTGAYSLRLPENATYTLQVTPVYQGYQSSNIPLTVGAAAQTRDVPLSVDPLACVALGYQTHYHGLHEAFQTGTLPAGWAQTSGTNTVGWEFDDPENFYNLTGDGGNFALVDSLNATGVQDTTLTSPATDMTGIASPELAFDTADLIGDTTMALSADVSVDDGATWTTVWQTTGDVIGQHVSVPLPQAAGKTAVLARFHVTGSGGLVQLAQAVLGSAPCDAVPGGLVVGSVTDANTKVALAGVTVTAAGSTASDGTSTAVDDPAIPGALYWLFSPATGPVKVSAALRPYVAATATATVTANAVTEADFAMTAPRLSVSPGSVAKTVVSGRSATQTVTVTNTGDAPATLNLAQESGAPVGSSSVAQSPAAAPAAATAVPTKLVPTTPQAGSLLVAAHKAGATPAAATAPASATATTSAPGGGAWQTLADYPHPISRAIADTYQGRVYAGFGFEWTAAAGAQDQNDLNMYDPATGAWTPLAPDQFTREAPAHGFIDGKLYVVGGYGADGHPVPYLDIYDPATNSWSQGAPIPQAYALSGSAVVGSTLYVVGGCGELCGATDVWGYDATTNQWTKRATYPEPTGELTCGNIANKLYCAGGVVLNATVDQSSKHTYVYDPAKDSWARLADAPVEMSDSAGTAANGQLLVSGGNISTDGVHQSITNQAWAYTAATNTWSALPNSPHTVFDATAAPGMYTFGGETGFWVTPPLTAFQVLPGYAGGPTVPWLSETPSTLTVAPGSSATITVALNAADPSVAQPGSYQAVIELGVATPYAAQTTVPVTLTVTPPASWGEITGTVDYAGPDGKPVAIPGATVQVDSGGRHYTLHADVNGGYTVWLPAVPSGATVIAAKDNFQPQVTLVQVLRGSTNSKPFVLLAD